MLFTDSYLRNLDYFYEKLEIDANKKKEDLILNYKVYISYDNIISKKQIIESKKDYEKILKSMKENRDKKLRYIEIQNERYNILLNSINKSDDDILKKIV